MQNEEDERQPLRLMIDPPAAGAWNMAVDEAMLALAADEGVATLRFYEWSEPTLSLGYFQQHAGRQQHAASVGCAVVRRQSGGGAILHDRELTYSLALPSRHPLAQDAGQLYRLVHGTVIEALEPRLSAIGKGWGLLTCEVDARPGRGSPFLCFQRRAAGDLLLVGDDKLGTSDKIVGSAQRRRRGAVLQHGSILLGTSRAAPELPGLRDRSGLAITTRQLAADLAIRIGKALDSTLMESTLPDSLLPSVETLVTQKYDSPTWTKRR